MPTPQVRGSSRQCRMRTAFDVCRVPPLPLDRRLLVSWPIWVQIYPFFSCACAVPTRIVKESSSGKEEKNRGGGALIPTRRQMATDGWPTDRKPDRRMPHSFRALWEMSGRTRTSFDPDETHNLSVYPY